MQLYINQKKINWLESLNEKYVPTVPATLANDALSKILALKEQLKQKTQEFEQLQEQLKNGEVEDDSKTEELAKLSQTLQALEAQIQGLEAERQKLVSDLERQTQESETDKKKITSDLKAQIQRLEEERKKLVSDLEKQTQESEAGKQKLTNDLEAYSRKILQTTEIERKFIGNLAPRQAIILFNNTDTIILTRNNDVVDKIITRIEYRHINSFKNIEKLHSTNIQLFRGLTS